MWTNQSINSIITSCSTFGTKFKLSTVLFRRTFLNHLNINFQWQTTNFCMKNTKLISVGETAYLDILVDLLSKFHFVDIHENYLPQQADSQLNIPDHIRNLVLVHNTRKRKIHFQAMLKPDISSSNNQKQKHTID